MNNKPYILFVDDDPLSREGFELVFGKKYNCIICDNANDGLQKFTSKCSVVIIDIRMSEKNGFELCNDIQLIAPEVPIIFYSAYPEDKPPLMVINEHHPFAFVTKSGDLEQLESTIESAIHHFDQITVQMNLDIVRHSMEDTQPYMDPKKIDMEPKAVLSYLITRFKQSLFLNNHSIKTKGDILILSDKQYAQLIHAMSKTVDANLNIFLCGDRGTGKTTIPHYIALQHLSRPFIYIDCYLSAVHEGYLNEQVIGIVENGILFFDNIHKLSKKDQEFLHQWIISSDQSHHVSIISSAPKSYMSNNPEIEFDQALFNELTTIRFELPSLDEMPLAKQELMEYFLQKYSVFNNQNSIGESEAMYFTSKKWPNNISSLESAIRQFCETDQKFDLTTVAKEHKEPLVKAALAACNNNISKASEYLGIKRTNLYQLIDLYKISVNKRSYQQKE